MIVVSDSTPLIHLAQAGGLDVLFSHYSEVVITPMVHREVVEEGLLLEKDDARVIQAYVGRHIRVKAPGSSSKALARKHRIHNSTLGYLLS
jgi:predicted nucleic acid-binding protein